MPISLVTNEDCMEMMTRYPDKFFELAIVDPPYGIGANGMTMGLNKGTIKRTSAEWDSKPPETDYFDEMRRVSKNWIVWGGNYFGQLWPSKCFIIWDKRQMEIPFRNMADSELAVCSFDRVARTFRFIWDGFQRTSEKDTVKWHPTQKPVALYEYCLKEFAKPGDKILDTHMGSGSSRIAAYKLGFDFYGCELDKDYFDAQEERFKKAINEPLFQTQPDPIQTKLL